MQTTWDQIIGLEEYLLKSALELLTQLITHKSRQAFFERSPIGVDPDTFCIDLVKDDRIDQVKDDSATFRRITAGAVTAVAAPVEEARKTLGIFNKV